MMIRSILTTVAVLVSTSVGYGTDLCQKCTKTACSDEKTATDCMHACHDGKQVEECMSGLPQDTLKKILSHVTDAKAAGITTENTDAPAGDTAAQ